MNDVDVAIVGAGPYGLSLAAHLRNLGVEHQVFGTPMSFWRDSMPPGMELKSEGKACDLSDPRGEFSIRHYYNEISRPFVGRVIVPAETFSAYAVEFQRRFVPEVDHRNVAHVTRVGDRFLLRLQDESRLRASRVVVATGIRDYHHIPDAMAALPKEFVTHSVEYGPVGRLAGQKVLVVGGGASAVDLAWAIHRHGSDVSLVCRQPRIKFHPEPQPRSWLSAIRSPDSPIGGGWDLWSYANLPNLFRYLPEFDAQADCRDGARSVARLVHDRSCAWTCTDIPRSAGLGGRCRQRSDQSDDERAGRPAGDANGGSYGGGDRLPRRHRQAPLPGPGAEKWSSNVWRRPRPLRRF